MGTGRICECCIEVVSLLQSYDGKRAPVNIFSDITISREEVETIVLYLQSWGQRQCSCCFRDQKNFERFNWALQTLILIVVQIIRRLGIQDSDSTTETVEDEKKNETSATSSATDFISADITDPEVDGNKSRRDSGIIDATADEDPVIRRPVWDVEDKDKLIHFVAKIFLNSFPTYIAYKQHMQMKNEEITSLEIQALGQFCEINEPEASPYLFRNVTLFCRSGGMEAITDCLRSNIPDTLALHQVNLLVTLAVNVKTWMNFTTMLRLYVPFRSAALGYMCSLVDTELKTTSARNMAEYIWGAVKDPVDAHMSFDKDGLDLAFRYFLCPTLTMRLAGLNQINNYINLFNELLNAEHIRDGEGLYQSLCRWLLDNQIIEHIFGPNLHVEVIKQSHAILSFLAMENQFTNEHVEIIWQAAQLKHCSKQVFDIVSSLICHMEPGPVLHLHHLLKKLEPKDHTEQSLYLTSALIKFIWTNATSALEEQNSSGSAPIGSGTGSGGSIVSVPASSTSPSNNSNLNLTGNQREREMSSSENSVSVEASHSDDEIEEEHREVQPPLGSLGSASGDVLTCPLPSSIYKPLCHLSGEESSTSDSVSDDDISGSGPSDKSISVDADADNVHLSSSGYVETHSDSDADEENENDENVVPRSRGIKKRKVLRRKKNIGTNNTRSVPIRRNTSRQRTRKVPLAHRRDASQKDAGQMGPESSALPLITPKDQETLDTSDVITQLGSLIEMQGDVANYSGVGVGSGVGNGSDTSPPPVLQEYAAETLDGSDGSYSSRMSTKSEKNMADFDGEDSNAEEELMQNLTQSQLTELAVRNQARKNRCGSGTLLLPPRAMRMFFRRKRFQSPSTFNFQIENVCQPGQTLLWDLIQDDKIVQLSEGLAIEAQKALTNLLCFGAHKLIRLKFIEGCLNNIANNQAVVVSLRLLPKLLTSFNQIRLPAQGDIHQVLCHHQVTLWADREHQMLEKFFNNLRHFKETDFSASPFPYHAHVQVRLEFLSVVFSSIGSPDMMRLSVSQVDQLWDIVTDPRCSDELFLWLGGQVRSRDQHALCHETFRHILVNKIPSLPPESITMHSLSLFQQLCNLARLSVLHDMDVIDSSSLYGGAAIASGLTATSSSMDYLWKIALYAHNTDVSGTAIQFLNNYYIGRQLEKEEEFVQRCMTHLGEALEEVVQQKTTSDDAALLRIQRALLLLKSHLEIFRRKYAYHLRRWSLEGKGVGSHGQLVGDKGAATLRIVIQPAGFHEKVTLELFTSDYVADLRAEVAKWWENLQSNLSLEKSSSNSTPVLGSLLTESPIRMITQGIELSAEYDEKILSEVPIKDLQLVYVSIGASRPQKRRDMIEYSSSMPPPPREKIPLMLLLQPQYFEQLFSLMQSLSEVKTADRSGGSIPSTKAQVLSRRVWDILMLLPTNPEIQWGFNNIDSPADGSGSDPFGVLLDPSSPQKLMYSLYIVEALIKQPVGTSGSNSQTDKDTSEISNWKQKFVTRGGLRHLFGIFSSGVLEFSENVSNKDWNEWKQDCLASLLKILCYLGVISEETEYLNELLYDVNEATKKKVKRRKTSTEKTPIPKFSETMLSVMEVDLVMTRLTNILQACSYPRDPNYYKTGFWGRAQVVHYAMAFLVCWASSQDSVRTTLYSQPGFSSWLRKLVLEDPEPAVRREICMGLYRLCLGASTDGKTGVTYAPELISHMLESLPISLNIRWSPSHFASKIEGAIVPILSASSDEVKEPYGPACRDYFWLLGRLIDALDDAFVKESIEHPHACAIDLEALSLNLAQSIISREYLETRHNIVCDDALVGLLALMTVVMKHNTPFKSSQAGQRFLKDIFDCIFALPSPSQRYLPKCKSQPARSATYDLLSEMARCVPENYFLLQSLLVEQHQSSAHSPYSWDYWPHEESRSPCGFVGLTNLGATCYMASCMQILYMMPQARASILAAKSDKENRHETTLKEMQRMFAYLMESERKAYNPRGFCKVYQMDHKPLNTGEQKDMAEFFIDLVSKLEDMTPELKKLVKRLFCGVTSNNVVSLDCNHVSRTLEEFYTVRCQVADMRNLYESLDEVTVKDTLEGDNMYTCSTCGKKVRAEKRACFKKLPRLLCFNTMRYTFNMITMMKEKVNTHFSFPMQLDMSGYVEKTLMPQEEKSKRAKEGGNGVSCSEVREEDSPMFSQETDDDEECYTYDLIGVTVHTGTADGGHYYSFIRDRVPPNKDKWYLFNDAEVKQFDPNQLGPECFGGEMSTKTYDSVTDKFMDFSFEKTNSAYMLFYERSPGINVAPGSTELLQPWCLPGGSSQIHAAMQFPIQVPTSQQSPSLSGNGRVDESLPTFELNKELEEWIWMDNTQFLRDKNIFDHVYFNFMIQVCCQIPLTLCAYDDVGVLAAKLSSTFFLETFIHAKEKPTVMQWVDLLTKQLISSPAAASWFLEHMAEPENTWLSQILLKCPNQMIRQMFQGLCYKVIQSLRQQSPIQYLPYPDSYNPDQINMEDITNYSCVSKFVARYLSLLDHSAKSNLKNLAEYFSLLFDLTKLGDEECLLLLSLQAITKMVNFYLGNKKDDLSERTIGEQPLHATDEEEEEEEIISIPTEKSKVASLEKMIALVATLVEKSRDHTNCLRLSVSDRDALVAARKGAHFYSFPFILQQIRDSINFQNTRNLIFSLCRWNEKLAEEVVIAIFQAIQKHPDMCHPYFKVLNQLAELIAGPPGMPKFTEFILSRILDVSEICPYPTLEWLVAQVPRNKVVHSWCLQSMGTWVEHFLITNNNQRVRNAAALLLVSLVPNQQFRQGYRSTKVYGAQLGNRELFAVTGEALTVLQDIYLRLLQLLKPARHYTDINSHGTSKLVSYFSVLTYFTVSKTEKLMFGQFFMDLWNLFHPRLSEPSIPCHHNKSALLAYWFYVCTDCPENIQRIMHNPNVVKQIGFNYILADHEDQEVVMFNRSMLPAYYGIMRLCCQHNRQFAMILARHQNITWAFKNISPFQNQYPAAVEELFKLMQIIIQKSPETSEQELMDITIFKRNTLTLYMTCLDARSSWVTLISAFRALVESIEDRIFVVQNNGLNLLFESFHMLHTMHHEATACHVTSEMVDLLTLLMEILRTFRPKEFAHGVGGPLCHDIVIQRHIIHCKEWPDILKKLATLLNTYNCSSLRCAAIDTLMEFLYILPNETVRTLVPLMAHWHSVCQDAQNSGMGQSLGPYFPKRSSHGHSATSLKSTVRPPRPMLQMAFPHLGQETVKGLDEEYDRQLHEFYSHYHTFQDLMCRVAFMKDAVNQEIITLSAMLGYEAAPLHFIQFPKLWIEVFNTPSIDRKYITMLVNTSHFRDYVELVILDERSCLTNIIIFNFLATYMPKIFDQIAKSDQICKMLLSIKHDCQDLVQKQLPDVETHAMGILGDLKVLSLFYTPTLNEKGNTPTPLPAPAPTVPQVLSALKQLNEYFETLLTKSNSTIDQSDTAETPSKKRKIESASDSNNPQPGTSTSAGFSSPMSDELESFNLSAEDAVIQKRSITRDLIMLLLGTIDTLIRGISPPTGVDVEENDSTGDSKNEPVADNVTSESLEKEKSESDKTEGSN